MTDSVTYSRPYAEAAYKIAVETDALDMWSDNLSICLLYTSDAADE